MKIILNQSDREVVHNIFENAKEEYGGFERLFATPLSFSEEDGTVKFRFPEWMAGIRGYLIAQYGFNQAGHLMLELMSEWIADGKFQHIPNYKSELSQEDLHSYDSEPLKRQHSC